MEKFEEKQLINSLGSQINKQKKLLTDMVENLEYYYPRWKQDPEADKNLLNQVYLVYQYAYSCLWYMKDQKILEFIKLIDSNTGIFGGNRGKVIVNGQSMNQKIATQQMGANGKVFESIYYEAFGKQNKQPKPTKKNPMVIPQEQSDDFFNCMQAYAFYNEHLKEEFNKLKTNFGSSKYYHKINNTLGKVLKTIGTCISIGVGIVAAAGVLATALVGAGAVAAIPAGMTAIAGGVATVCKHGGQIGQAYRHGKVTKKYGRLVKELILTTLGIGKVLIGAGIIQKPDILGKVMELFKKGETNAAAAEMTKIVKEAEIPEDKYDEIAEQIAEMQQLSEDVEDVAPTDDIKEEFFSKVEISNEGETNIDTLVQDAPEEPEILSSAEQLANNGGDATEAATDATGEVEITPEEVDQEVAEVLNNPNEVAQDIEEVSADQSVLDKTPESAEQAEVEIEQDAAPEPEAEVEQPEANGAEQGTETNSTEQQPQQGTEAQSGTEQASDNTQQGTETSSTQQPQQQLDPSTADNGFELSKSQYSDRIYKTLSKSARTLENSEQAFRRIQITDKEITQGLAERYKLWQNMRGYDENGNPLKGKAGRNIMNSASQKWSELCGNDFDPINDAYSAFEKGSQSKQGLLNALFTGYLQYEYDTNGLDINSFLTTDFGIY